MKYGQKMGKLLLRYILIDTIAILLPVLLLALVLARRQNQEATRRYLETEDIALAQMERQVEDAMLTFSRTAQQIARDNELTAYALQIGDYHTQLALRKLDYYRASAPPFESLGICLNGSGRIWQPQGGKSLSTFANVSFHPTGTLTEEQLYTLLEAHQRFGVFSATQQLATVRDSFTLVTYPLARAGQDPYGTLVGILAADFYQSALPTTGGALVTYICEGGGRLLYASDGATALPAPLVGLLTATEQPYHTLTLEGVEVEAVVRQAPLTGWVYLRLIDHAQIAASQTAAQKQLIVLAGAVGLALAALTGLMLAIYNYLPIHKLFKLFSDTVPYREKRSELLLLNDYICDLKDRNTSIAHQLQLRELDAVRRVLKRLLDTGAAPDAADAALLAQQGVVAGRQLRIVCLQSVRPELGNDGTVLEGRLNRLRLPGLFFITQDPPNCFILLWCGAFGEGEGADDAKGGAKARGAKGGEAVDGKGNEVAAEAGSAETGAEHAAARLCEALEDESFHLRAGVSGAADSLVGLQSALEESVLALELDADSPVAVFDQLTPDPLAEPFWRPRREELLLHLALQRGDKGDALKKLALLQDTLCGPLAYHHKHETRFILYRVAGYWQDSPLAAAADLPAAMEQLVDYRDVPNFFAILAAQLAAAGQEVPGLSDAKAAKLREILAFIDEGYCQPQMGLSYVAGHFGIGDSYFSKLFKECAGVNFIDYISDKRMEEGRRLLLETHLSVQKVVESIGYSDLPSFSRKFSRKYGMSPGAYRKAAARPAPEQE